MPRKGSNSPVDRHEAAAIHPLPPNFISVYSVRDSVGELTQPDGRVSQRRRRMGSVRIPAPFGRGQGQRDYHEKTGRFALRRNIYDLDCLRVRSHSRPADSDS